VKSTMMRVAGSGALAILLLTGCATLGLGKRHLGFTESAVLKLRVGMTADVVRARFGNPDRTEVTTCGSSTPDPWQCMIWRYQMEESEYGDVNRFYFAIESDPPRLHSWDIERMYPDQSG
jgi:hypothetical protein